MSKFKSHPPEHDAEALEKLSQARSSPDQPANRSPHQTIYRILERELADLQQREQTAAKALENPDLSAEQRAVQERDRQQAQDAIQELKDVLEKQAPLAEREAEREAQRDRATPEHEAEARNALATARGRDERAFSNTPENDLGDSLAESITRLQQEREELNKELNSPSATVERRAELFDDLDRNAENQKFLSGELEKVIPKMLAEQDQLSQQHTNERSQGQGPSLDTERSEQQEPSQQQSESDLSLNQPVANDASDLRAARDQGQIEVDLELERNR